MDPIKVRYSPEKGMTYRNTGYTQLKISIRQLSKLESHRWFSPQFKAETVQILSETGRPTAVVARDLGIKRP